MLSCFVEVSELNAKSVDPDQTPRSAASDLGLLCLQMHLLSNAKLKWAYSADDKLAIFFLFFIEKLNLAFHANCLDWRHRLKWVKVAI